MGKFFEITPTVILGKYLNLNKQSGYFRLIITIETRSIQEMMES